MHIRTGMLLSFPGRQGPDWNFWTMDVMTIVGLQEMCVLALRLSTQHLCKVAFVEQRMALKTWRQKNRMLRRTSHSVSDCFLIPSFPQPCLGFPKISGQKESRPICWQERRIIWSLPKKFLKICAFKIFIHAKMTCSSKSSHQTFTTTSQKALEEQWFGRHVCRTKLP